MLSYLSQSSVEHTVYLSLFSRRTAERDCFKGRHTLNVFGGIHLVQASPLHTHNPLSPRPPAATAPSADSVSNTDSSAVSPSALRDFHDAIGRFTHADWHREQNNEPVCKAAIRLLRLGHPDPLPPDFFGDTPANQRPPLQDIRALADKGRLFTNKDGVTLLVRKPTAQDSLLARPRGRAARLLNDEPIRVYVPMLMRPFVMQACHANTLCHLGAAKALSLLEHFY